MCGFFDNCVCLLIKCVLVFVLYCFVYVFLIPY